MSQARVLQRTASPRQLSSGTVLLRRKTTVIGTGQRIASHYLVEWSPAPGKWYPIKYRDVAPASLDDPAFVATYRQAMNRLLQGETIELEAEYVAEAKVLLVKEVL